MIMDQVVLGDECIVGALAFIKTGEQIPERSMVVGNPAKIIKQVSDEMMNWKTEGTKLYQALPFDMQQNWGPVESLTSLPADQSHQQSVYKTWNETTEK